MAKKIYNAKTGKLSDSGAASPARGFRMMSTPYNPHHEPESYIEWADVNRVGMAIRAARGGSVQPLFALYRDIILADSHIQGELAKRKLAVIGDVMRVIPYDKTQQADKDAASFCEQQIYGMSGWRMAMANLMDGVLWPVSVLEKVYQPSDNGYDLSELPHVPAYLLDYSTGKLQIRDVKEDGTPTGDTHEPDPRSYIVHRGHLLSTPDNFGGPMRSLVYWWLASSMNRDWWLRFLERYGAPFMVGKYTPGNGGDRALILDAMSTATRMFGLAISRDTEIELVEASKASSDAFAQFIAVAQREKSKLILGQTLSSTADATGMGSGVADLQSDVREDIRKHDGAMLAETLRDQLLTQLCDINRLPGRAPYVIFGKASNAEITSLNTSLTALSTAGFEPDDDALEPISETIGFTIRRRDASTQSGGWPGLGLKTPMAVQLPNENTKLGVGADAVSSTALNGAQISSLLAVIADTVKKQIPFDTAKAILHASFPMLDESVIDSVLDPLTSHVLPPPEDARTDKPSN